VTDHTPPEVVFDNLRSGLTTDSMLEDDPPGLRVSWIAWGSGFHASGLQIGDQIIAVNGETVPRPTDGSPLTSQSAGAEAAKKRWRPR